MYFNFKKKNLKENQERGPPFTLTEQSQDKNENNMTSQYPQNITPFNFIAYKGAGQV